MLFHTLQNTNERITADFNLDGENDDLELVFEDIDNTIKNNTEKLQNQIDSMGAAMLNGASDLLFSLKTASSVNISASTLNAADADTIGFSIRADLRTSLGNVHKWATKTLVITPAESVADNDISAPTVLGTTLEKGCVLLTVMFDTDAGATKNYTSGDSLTVDIDLGTILGIVIPVLTVTYNVV